MTVKHPCSSGAAGALPAATVLPRFYSIALMKAKEGTSVVKATLRAGTVQPPRGTHWAPDPWTLGPI